MPEIVTAPTETAIATGDLILFTDVSETPDALNAITVDNLLGASPMKIASTSPTLGVGYATGAGNSATQGTSKATAVAFNAACGKITMHNAALAAGTIVSFTFTNTAIAATDVMVLNHLSGGTVGSYSLNAQCGAGSATINVRNNTAGSLGEAIVISFAVIKAVIT